MKIKILIADDEKEFVETLAQRLEMRDFSVTTVCSGEGAIEIAEKISELSGISLDEVARITTENARQLFGV